MAGKLRLVEPVLLVVGALACSGPVLYVLNPPSSFPVLAAAMVRPVVDLPAFAAKTAAALPEGACVSLGVAALVPDAVGPGKVIGPEADLSTCRSVFLFNGDLDYPALRPKVEGYAAGPVIEGRIERYDQRP